MTEFFNYSGVIGVDANKHHVVVYTTDPESEIPTTDGSGRPVEVIVVEIKNGQVSCEKTLKPETISNGGVGTTTCSIPLPESLASLRAAASALWKAAVQVFHSYKSSRSEKQS